MFQALGSTADQSFGEWETEYPRWNKIYQTADKLIEADPIGEWSGELLDEFRFILARDNECENIIDLLTKSKDQLIAVAFFQFFIEQKGMRK